MVFYSVIWSPTARLTYYKILEYLIENWTFKKVEAFTDKYLCDAQARQHPQRVPYQKYYR
jgi:hypothetical protein